MFFRGGSLACASVSFLSAVSHKEGEITIDSEMSHGLYGLYVRTLGVYL